VRRYVPPSSKSRVSSPRRYTSQVHVAAKAAFVRIADAVVLEDDRSVARLEGVRPREGSLVTLRRAVDALRHDGIGPVVAEHELLSAEIDVADPGVGGGPRPGAHDRSRFRRDHLRLSGGFIRRAKLLRSAAGENDHAQQKSESKLHMFSLAAGAVLPMDDDLLTRLSGIVTLELTQTSWVR
jgi:hypothetical protein